MKKEEEQKIIQHEKALFDFDEEINDLENVTERYPVEKPQKESPNKENNNEGMKEEKKQEVVKNPYAIKRTERPKFDTKILMDL